MLKSESYKKGVFTSTLLNIFSKSVVFINTLIITYIFGAKSETDVYYYVIGVSAFICNIIIYVDIFVLMPEAIRIKEQINENASRRFLNFFIYLYLLAGLSFAVFGFVFPNIFYSFFSSFKVGYFSKFALLLSIGAFFIFFQLLLNLFTAILSSYKYFTIAILANLINSLFVLGFTIFLHKSMGIASTFVGLLIGYLVNFFFIIVVLKIKLKWNFADVKIMRDIKIWKSIGLVQLNFLPLQLRAYLALILLTSLGEGILSAVNISQTIASIPEVFILAQIASVASVKLSELNAKNDYSGTITFFYKIYSLLFFLMIPVSIVMTICSKEIVEVLYMRGNFTKENVVFTGFCLFYFGCVLPSKIPDLLFSRLYTSFQGLNKSVWITGLANCIVTVFTFFAIKNFKLNGYFFSLLIGGYVIIPFAFYLIFSNILPKLKDKRIFIVSLKGILLGLIASLPLYYINKTLGNMFIPLKITLIGFTTILFFSIPFYWWGKFDFLSKNGSPLFN